MTYQQSSCAVVPCSVGNQCSSQEPADEQRASRNLPLCFIFLHHGKKRCRYSSLMQMRQYHLSADQSSSGYVSKSSGATSSSIIPSKISCSRIGFIESSRRVVRRLHSSRFRHRAPGNNIILNLRGSRPESRDISDPCIVSELVPGAIDECLTLSPQ